MRLRASARIFLVSLLLANLLRVPAWAQTPTGLQIVIVEGEGAINNIRQRVNREEIVQVEDQNHKPVSGAVVLFLLPDQGASGTFADGARMLATVTDNQGRAVAKGIKPNSVSGPMQMLVTASFSGLTASAVIRQTNVAGAAAATTGLSVTAKVLLIVGIAGGATAAGIVIANHVGGSSTPITIMPGTPSVGAP